MSLTPEQLEIRRTMVTATDTRALAGEDPNRGPLEVYLEKVQPVTPWEGNHATRIGERLEPLALAFLSEHLDRPIVAGTTERDPLVPHFGASIDGNILACVGGERVGIGEAKAVGLRSAKYWDGRQPPDRVLVQVTKQMIVTRFRVCWVVALIGTEPRFYEVELHDSLANALAEQDDAFWRNHVVPRIAPEPDGSDSSSRAIKQLFPKVKGDVFRAGPEIEELAREYFEAKRAADAAAQREAELANRMKAAIGEHAGVEGDGWRAMWREKRTGVAWKRAFEALGPKVDPGTLEQFRGEPTREFKCDGK